MQQEYLVYVHEKDRYDFYMLQDVLRSASRHFIINFEEVAELFFFLKAIQDGLYPKLVVVDVYDGGQMQALLTKIRALQDLSFIPLWILSDIVPEKTAYHNSIYLERPRHRDAWEALAYRIAKHISAP